MLVGNERVWSNAEKLDRRVIESEGEGEMGEKDGGDRRRERERVIMRGAERGRKSEIGRERQREIGRERGLCNCRDVSRILNSYGII